MGWFSRIRNPLVRGLSIAVWRLFTDLDLSDAREQRFDSLHDCFTRELKAGARTIDPDPDVLTSPCDAIVGACGPVHGLAGVPGQGLSVLGSAELFGDAAVAAPFRDGCFVTLRLTSSMYHRFHAPHVQRASSGSRYLSGDTWNVNPIALKRVERLFCRNERARCACAWPAATPIALVPVAAILVASMRLHASTCCCICATADRSASTADVAVARARSSAGSSTARPSWCSRRPASRCATAWSADNESIWVGPC